MDIIIKSGGIVSYQDIMTMPVNSIVMLVERLNAANEEKKQAMDAARSKR
jgi:hypothetical protein